MKNLLKALLIVGVFTLFINKTNAQAKFAHVNFSDLVQNMPDTKIANMRLDSFQKELQKTLETMMAEYKKKQDEYNALASNASEAIRAAKEKELGNLYQNIQDFQQGAAEEVQTKQNEYLQPIIDKAKKACSDAAKAGGYSYVFDNSPGGALIYHPETDDLMVAVKKLLNIK